MIEIAKLPPQAPDLEENIIGAMLLDPECVGDVTDILSSADMFYRDDNRVTYAAILELSNNNSPIDLGTVTEALKKGNNLDRAGGVYRLAQLSNKIGSAANAKAWAMIVYEKYLAREIIRVSSLSIADAFDDSSDPMKLLDKMQTELIDLQNGINSKSDVHFYAVVRDSFDSIYRELNGDKGEQGLTWGIREFDTFTRGLMPGTLTIVAARPSMGKTALTGYMALRQAQAGIPVGYFSLEMTKEELAKRLVYACAGVSSNDIQEGNDRGESRRKLLIAEDVMLSLPMQIDDRSGVNIHQVRAKIRKWVKRHGVQVVYIDYLQIMAIADKHNRNEGVGAITRELKSIAKELKISIVLLSQLSRQVEQRGGYKIPQLSDLRDSGEIEQDADIVMFVYRPAYYQFNDVEIGGKTYPAYDRYDNSITFSIFAKNRNGKTGIRATSFDPKRMTFYDIDLRDYEVENYEQPKKPRNNLPF